jgi:S-adenosylmethionine-diacylglycerol 3-amino-3-carboxypropyl transferase
MDQQLVLDGVLNKPVSTKQGILQKLFAVWFDAFVYNQIWEDPRVDLRALELDANSRVLTISSGGCNALNYLAQSPEIVTAVDLNRHHIYLLNLKIAALRGLEDHQDFFQFFGYGKSERAWELYKTRIKPNLDSETREFWETGLLFRRDRISFFERAGLYEHSRNGYFLRFFHRLASLFGCKPDEILKAKTLEEQERLYKKHVDPFFNNFLVKILGKMPVTMFGLGIPPQQYDELKHDLTTDKNVIEIYRERVKRLACDHPINDNYFAWQAFARKYDTEKRVAVPEYLKKENFEKLKANASRIRTRIGSVTDEIKNSPHGAFNRFVFLDAQDWMDEKTITDLWRAIANNATSSSRIIFRTASAFSPVEIKLPAELREKFVYEKEFSRELFKQDRASIYGGFHLYILK